MATRSRSLDGAVDKEFAVLPDPTTPISRDEASQVAQISLEEALTTLAQNHPREFRKALERFGRAHPSAYREAVPDMYDEQTGLTAKDYFENIVLPEQVEKARDEGAPVCLLKVDIDYFKKFNDKYGWQIGDEVIAYVAEAIKGSVRTNKGTWEAREPDIAAVMRDEYVQMDGDEFMFARIGQGEEFGIVLYNTQLKDAYMIGERLRRAVADHHLRTNKGELSVTISVGIAELEPGMAPYELIGKADSNLKAAKDAGRNRVYAEGYLNPVAYDAPPTEAPEARVA